MITKPCHTPPNAELIPQAAANRPNGTASNPNTAAIAIADRAAGEARDLLRHLGLGELDLLAHQQADAFGDLA